MNTPNSDCLDDIFKEYIPKGSSKYYDIDDEAVYMIEDEDYRAFLSYEYPMIVHYIRFLKGKVEDGVSQYDRRLDSIKHDDEENINLIKEYLKGE